MEIVIGLFVLFGVSLSASAWIKNRGNNLSTSQRASVVEPAAISIRSCASCGFTGEMKTWISHYTRPKLLLLLGFVLGYVPGLLFLVYYWGKFKCPTCGTVGKNR